MDAAFARRLWRRLPASVKSRFPVVLYAAHGAPPLRSYAREVMNKDINAWFSTLAVGSLDAVEVSGTVRSNLGWRSYTSLQYPQFDIVTSAPPSEFDVVVCEQVLEHVPDPCAAIRNLRRLTRPGGHILVSTPFLIRLHGSPDDYWRFTPLGLRTLLEREGLVVDTVKSWGNRSAVVSNLRRWSFYLPWRSLRDTPDLPVVVWATSRRDTGSAPQDRPLNDVKGPGGHS
jgi:SAM-dependent methyltransferase